MGCKNKAPPKQEGKVQSAKVNKRGSSLAAPAEAYLYNFASKVRITEPCRYMRVCFCQTHAHSLRPLLETNTTSKKRNLQKRSIHPFIFFLNTRLWYRRFNKVNTSLNAARRDRLPLGSRSSVVEAE